MKTTKYYFILIAHLFLSITGSAQTNVYNPFPDSNFIWVQFSSSVQGDCCCSGNVCIGESEYQYYIAGDTVFGQNTYKKIYKTGSRKDYISGPATCPPSCDPIKYSYFKDLYFGAIRQDIIAKKVYTYKDSKETLLYDFDLHIGDTLPQTFVNEKSYDYVSAIDSVLVDNTYHKRYAINGLGDSTSPFVFLIEGIGSSFGLFSPMTYPFEFINNLVCAKRNLITVYPDATFNCIVPTDIKEQKEMDVLIIYPNPMETYTTIILNQNHYNKISFAITDLLGRNQAGLITQEISYLQDKIAITINRNILPGGYYLYKVFDQAKLITTEKIIVN